MGCLALTVFLLQAMLAALLYSTAGFSLAAVGGLALMATVAFSSIFVVVAGGKPRPNYMTVSDGQHAFAELISPLMCHIRVL